MSSPVAGADQRALAQMANQLAEQQRQIELIKMGQNQASLGFSSIEDGSLVIYDADGNPRLVIGKQDDGSYVPGAAGVTLDPPEVPNPPTCVPGFGTIRVESHGSSDPPWPKSFSHLNIYLSSGTGETEEDPITPGVVVGNIIGMDDSSFVISGLDPVSYRIWLTSVGIDTAESDASPAVTVTPTMVVGQDILDGAITELQLADDAVTAAKLAAESVGSIQIQGEAIDVTKLADGSVDGEKIVANAIGVGHLAAASVTSVAIAAGAVQADNIAVGAIQAGHLAVDSVTAANILALQIQADHLAANAVTAGKLAVGAVTADKLQADIIIADATFETGTAGRRIVISGPANEIRFFPQLNETAYGRIFSYVSDLYPDDVNIEFRAIDSDEVNVQPRFVLTPDSLIGVITDRGDETIYRGGRFNLEEEVSAFGVKNDANAQDQGIFFYTDAGIKFHGWFENHRVQPSDAMWISAVDYTNSGATNTYISGLTFTITSTHPQPYVSFPSVSQLGIFGSSSQSYPRWLVRTGYDHPDATDVDFGNHTTEVLWGKMTIGVRILCFNVDSLLAYSQAGVNTATNPFPFPYPTS